VRLVGADTELLGIDREAEVAAGTAAASAGVGPEVIAWLPELGAMVTRFLPGDPIPEQDLQDPAVVRLIAGSVMAIHGCPPIDASFPVYRIVERYRDLAASRGVQIPSAWDDAHRLAGRIEASFAAAPMRPVTCHNDLLNANFLRQGDHVWIVDYEYAGMGDPFFDMGNLSVNNGLGKEAQEALLASFFGDVRDVHRARLALMRLISDLREAMWGVVQQAISKLDFDYVGYAEHHFDRLLAGAADDRLEDWLTAAAAPADR
jgi:thiamine kinase-like enzyme